MTRVRSTEEPCASKGARPVRLSEGSAPLTESNRAIRPGVLWRKGSFGTHSPEGSRFVEAIMTVVATLKQQHRNVLDYLTAACEATLHGKAVPSLLPTLATLEQSLRSAA
jgi:transposase